MEIIKMPEQPKTQCSTYLRQFLEYCSLARVIIISGFIGIGIGGLDRLVCQKKIENIEVTEVGETNMAYDSGSSEYLTQSIDYKDVPRIYITGHDKCICGDDLAGIKAGDKLVWIRYTATSAECDYLKGFEKAE